MSSCECARNQADCPVCELYNMMHMKDFRTWDCPSHDEIEEIVHRAEKEYHHEIVTRYDGAIGET